MHRRIRRIVILSVCLLLFPIREAIPVPIEVTLFPTSACVTEQTKVRPEKVTERLSRCMITLPATADPHTLSMRLIGASNTVLIDYDWRPLSSAETAKAKTVAKKLDELKVARIRLQASLRALESQLVFWQNQTKGRVKNMVEAGNTALTIGKNIQKLTVEKISTEAALDHLERQIKEWEHMARDWEVTCYVSGTPDRDVTLTYTYLVTGCRWTPRYRLEAHPETNEISFMWMGELLQHSSEDWRNVTIRLASQPPEGTRRTVERPSWIVKTGPETGKAKQTPSSASKPLDRDIHTLWEIGKGTIPHGKETRLLIREDRWPAEFTYVARPSIDQRAFLQAKVQRLAMPALPAGSATFFLHGISGGKQEISLLDGENTFIFGPDSLVTVTAKLLTPRSGERALFPDRQAVHWKWVITAVNRRSHDVDVLLEEPIPESTEGHIKVLFSADPAPASQNAHAAQWRFTLPPGAKKEVAASVTLEAPRDITIDSRWHGQ